MSTKKTILSFLGVYFFIRVFSFFFFPATPLQEQSLVNSVLSLGILSITALFLVRGHIAGWYIVLLEILLGGSGAYLAIEGISLRSLLLIVSTTIFIGHKLHRRELRQMLNDNRPTSLLIGTLVLIALAQALHGYGNGHPIGLVIADLIPYGFLLYYFPLRELLRDEQFKTIGQNAIITAIIGNAILVVLTFVLYSFNLFILQDVYYHWYRDVASGKITALPYHFYRLVLNEHLLLVPVLLITVAKGIYKKFSSAELALIALMLLILATNLTRVYLLALGVGLFALFSRAHLKRWILISAGTVVSFVALFVSLHLFTSRGASLGLELFGLRLQSIVSPSIEDSSLSRMLLLPNILEKITAHPVIGEGLGATVSAYSPVFETIVTTPHFDWGYLELLAELGLIGVVVWVVCIATVFQRIKQNTLSRGDIASFVALLITNLTSPALFHVFGILFIVYLLAKNKKTSE
jgi:O-antigen ligase